MPDQYYDSVILEAPLNGANGGTVFTEYSPINKPLTRMGNVVTSTAQSKYYGSSGYFQGTVNDYLYLLTNSVFDFGSLAFTVEAWVYIAARSIADAGGNYIGGILGFHNGGTTNWGLWIAEHATLSQATALYFETNLSGVSGTQGRGITMPFGEWHHVSACRSGNTLYLGYDGNVSSFPLTQNVMTGNSNGKIGGHLTHSSYQRPLNGYIQDLRVTRGIARYTANFTPPAKLLGTLSGTVKDDTGANASRTVVAFPSLAPEKIQFMASTGGAFSFSNMVDTDHSVLCIDDAAGTVYNDLIYRTAPV